MERTLVWHVNFAQQREPFESGKTYKRLVTKVNNESDACEWIIFHSFVYNSARSLYLFLGPSCTLFFSALHFSFSLGFFFLASLLYCSRLHPFSGTSFSIAIPVFAFASLSARRWLARPARYFITRSALFSLAGTPRILPSLFLRARDSAFVFSFFFFLVHCAFIIHESTWALRTAALDAWETMCLPRVNSRERAA